MPIIIKFIIFFLFLNYYLNRKNLQLLMLLLFFFIDFCRVLFLDKMLNHNLLSFISIIQLILISVAIVLYILLYILSLIKRKKDGHN